MVAGSGNGGSNGGSFGTSTGGPSDTSKYDNTDWKNLNGDVNNGSLGINHDVKAADQVFLKSAQAVHELNQQMSSYAKFLTDNKLNAIEAISNELGGTELTNIFNQKGTSILDGITGLQQILTNMENTFVGALKAYSTADSDSADAIGKATVKNDPASRTQPGASDYSVNADDDMPDAPTTPTNHDTGQTVSISDASSWGFDDFYHFGRSIINNNQSDWATDIASVQYTWMATQMSGDISTLVAQLKNIKGDMWTGTGAAAAEAAVTRFENGSNAFTDSINELANVLKYTSTWLKT